MKSTIVIIALSFAYLATNAQTIKEAEVPAKVKEAFAQKYAGAKAEEWIKEKADFEVEFDLNKVESSAVFTADGTFKELEQEIKLAQLPKAASDYCAKNYVGYKLSEAAKITDATDKVQFEAEMEKGKEHFDVIFDDKGNFVKKVVIEKESKKDGKD